MFYKQNSRTPEEDLKKHQVFTKALKHLVIFNNLVKTWWFLKKNTRFFKITIFKNLVKTWWFFQISPGFHQVLKITTFSTICLSLVIFQNLVKTWWFSSKITRFSPSFWKTTIFKQISPRKHLFFTKIKVKTLLLLIFEGVKRLFWLNFKTWWKPGDFLKNHQKITRFSPSFEKSPSWKKRLVKTLSCCLNEMKI